MEAGAPKAKPQPTSPRPLREEERGSQFLDSG